MKTAALSAFALALALPFPAVFGQGGTLPPGGTVPPAAAAPNPDHQERLAKLGITTPLRPGPRGTAVADLRLEEGYGSISRRAIRKLLPRMEQAVPYATARKEEYPESNQAQQALEHLPGFAEVMKNVRNPAVTRTMAELRKVVNALLRKFGSNPEFIRVELSRDLKHSRDRRKQMTEDRDRNTKSRDDARSRLLKEIGEKYATDRNILKLRLAQVAPDRLFDILSVDLQIDLELPGTVGKTGRVVI